MPNSHTTGNQQPATSDQQSSTINRQPFANKVLIITYYWPPSGGSGVQRWLKFVKYLPQFGWEPFVFTPENPSFEIRDDTLMKDVPAEAEVIHFPIWEPYGVFDTVAKIFGRRSASQIDLVVAGRKSFFQKVTGWVRGNLFIPDARIFWVRPSVAFLSGILKSNAITTVVTTGPPHSLHLIGLKIKQDNPAIRWIADLRDPWSEWDFLDTLSLTPWARSRHRMLERRVLATADRVITIAPYHVARFEALGGRKVDLITNGYDDEDFKGIEKVRTKKFTIRHIGMVDQLRDPRPFMEAIGRLAEAVPAFAANAKIEFIGSVNSIFREYVSQNALLSAMTIFSPPMPHAALLKLYGETDVQLLILAHTTLAPGNLPGKFFEYLASGNFIFGVGPEAGDAGDILRETNAGLMIERTNGSKIQETIRERFERWSSDDSAVRRDVSAFARRELTRKLAGILGGVTSPP